MSPKNIAALGQEVIDALKSRMESPEEWKPRRTGLEDFDKIVRILPGRIYTIEGKEKSAKTTLAVHMAKALACNDKSKVLYIQCEESSFDMGVRVLTSLTADVDRNHIMDMKLTEQHFEELQSAQKKTQKMNFDVEDRTFTTDGIFKLIRSTQANVIIVDYFQLLSDKIANARTSSERFSEISMKIVRFKNDFRDDKGALIPLTFFLIAQLNEDLKVNQTRQLGRDIDQAIRITEVQDAISGGSIDGTLKIKSDRGRIGHGGECVLSFNGAHSRVGNAFPVIDDTGNPFAKLVEMPTSTATRVAPIEDPPEPEEDIESFIPDMDIEEEFENE
jgi:archaellum biogenesis ATPase FlaH